MTKASMIRGLIRQRFSNVQIAEMIGCSDAYVRVVRQRAAGVCHSDTAFKARYRERNAECRQAFRDAYRAARDSGQLRKDAHRDGCRAVRRAAWA